MQKWDKISKCLSFESSTNSCKIYIIFQKFSIFLSPTYCYQHIEPVSKPYYTFTVFRMKWLKKKSIDVLSYYLSVSYMQIFEIICRQSGKPSTLHMYLLKVPLSIDI